MKKLLKKLTDTHYIIMDDSEIKEKDYCYSLSNGLIVQLNKISADTINSKPIDDVVFLKITHSTEPLNFLNEPETAILKPDWTNVKFIYLLAVEELILGYSIEKMADNAYVKHSVKDNRLSLNEQIQRIGGFNIGYQEGFNAHKQLTKDKLFTINDIRNAFNAGQKYGEDNACNAEVDVNNNETQYIQSLLPQSEWDVEFDEQGKLKLI